MGNWGQIHCTLPIRLLDYDLISLDYFNSGLLSDYGVTLHIGAFGVQHGII